MIMARLSCWPRFVALAIALAIIVAGCREELGPEVIPTTRVSGTVVEGGSAVGGGWIEFVPVEGTRGRIRSARIQNDGKFQTDRVSIGMNAIRMVNVPIQLRGGRELFGNYATTPVRRLIPAQPGGPLKIDLLEEAVRYQAQRSRMTAGRTKEAAAGAEP
jgi:hypothetical protein